MSNYINTLYIVIHAYNEHDNIRQCIDDWYQIVEKYWGYSCLIVIDDGSKDNTYEILCEEAKNKPVLQLLTKPNGGHGHTVQYGYRY